ncbi:hypothetical protein DAMA08_045910 [Martiniozyma asiatica (nom. inval.)]|nr:hypothetical protein DAMA08_045910 [Martiniozyma asiatica]
MLPIFIVLLIASSIWNFVNAAGIAVHVHVANLLSNRLGQTLHVQAYYAGSFFPDSLYSCFDESNNDKSAGEFTHWPPFLKNAVEYYREHYMDRQNSDNAKKLKAFIYGVFTHQVTDVSWHSLQSYQGFIKMISVMEFNGNFQAAHDWVDTASDFVLLYKQFSNLSTNKERELFEFYNNQVEWGNNYPLSDIVNILQLSGFDNIIEEKLDVCMKKGIAGLRAELASVSAAIKNPVIYGWDPVLTLSPLAAKSIFDYYYGGIDQITETLQGCWIQLDDFFKNDPGKKYNEWQICSPVFKEHDISKAGEIVIEKNYKQQNKISSVSLTNIFSSDFNLKSTFISNGVPMTQFGSSLLVGNFLGEITLAVGAPYEDLGSIYLLPLNDLIVDKKTFDFNINCVKFSKELESKNAEILPYPLKYGAFLDLWILNGSQYMVISEPGTSNVFVYEGIKKIAIIKFDSKTSLGDRGIKELRVLGIDSMQNLLVGGPYVDGQREHEGLIWKLSGIEFMKKINEIQNEPLIVNSAEITISYFTIPDTLKQESGFDHFADSLAVLNDGIAVSIGALGIISIFDNSGNLEGLLSNGAYISMETNLNKTKTKTKTKNQIQIHNQNQNQNQLLLGTLKNANLKRKTSKESKLFGSFIETGFFENIEWMIVGQPADNIEKICPQCGSAILFIKKNTIWTPVCKFVPEIPHFGMSNKFYHGLFGSNSHKISNTHVIISSSGYDNGKGAIYIVDVFSAISIGKNDIKNTSELPFVAAEQVIVGTSNVGWTDFGASLTSFTIGNSLYVAVGMPKYGLSNFESNLKLGYVQIFELSF